MTVMTVDYCPCRDDKDLSCPACGATIEGNDSVRGMCQARYPYMQRASILFVEIRNRKTGNVVSSWPVL